VSKKPCKFLIQPFSDVFSRPHKKQPETIMVSGLIMVEAAGVEPAHNVLT
jgi:hypothetical protein